MHKLIGVKQQLLEEGGHGKLTTSCTPAVPSLYPGWPMLHKAGASSIIGGKLGGNNPPTRHTTPATQLLTLLQLLLQGCFCLD